MLLSAAWAGSSAGCLIVIGEKPERDAASEIDTDAETPDADIDAGQGTPGDAAQEAGDAGAPPSDAGTRDAESDAAPEAGFDPDAAADTGGQPSDAGTADAGGEPDCGAGTQTWYPDDDGDGYGRSTQPREACSKPEGKWSSTGGDCRDNDEKVHPNQTMFFEQAYSLGNGLDSFDYDCANGEEGDPTQALLEGGCGPIVDLLVCTSEEKGYATRPERSGPGLNSRCGSKRMDVCVWQALALVCTSVQQDVQMPYRCR